MGLKNFLLGKKDPGTPDREISLDPALREMQTFARGAQQRAGQIFTKELGRLKTADPLASVTARQALQTRGLKGIIADKTRLARQEVAKRGLGQSSVGLGAILRAGDEERRMMGDIRAARPLEEEAARDRLMGRVGGISRSLSGILSAPGKEKTLMIGRQPGGRSGGLLGALLPAAGMAGGAFAGSMTGNPMMAAQGAQMGGQMGGNLAGAFQGRTGAATAQPYRAQYQGGNILGSYWQ